MRTVVEVVPVFTAGSTDVQSSSSLPAVPAATTRSKRTGAPILHEEKTRIVVQRGRAGNIEAMAS